MMLTFTLSPPSRKRLMLFVSELDIMVVRPRPELYLFDSDDGLMLLGLVGLLVQLYLIFPEVHDAADRRYRSRRHLYQVKPRFLSLLKGLPEEQDPQLFAFRRDDAA